MTEPFVKEFDIQGTKVTSVVLDPEDFEAFCDELIDVFNVGSGERTNREGVEKIRKAGHLPLMAKGTKTEKFFTRWNVKTAHMGVIKRGAFQRMVDQSKGMNN